MSRSARNNHATTILLHHVGQGATGRLVNGAGAAALYVYLMQGQLMAAVAHDDDHQLVRLAHLRGGLTDSQMRELQGHLEASQQVFGLLLDAVPTDLMDQLLLDRFRQNLATFLGGSSKPSFEPLRTVMVDNLQMSHDTRGVIDEACRLWDEADALDLDALLVRGDARPENKEQRIVAARLSSTPRTVSSLLVELPLEPLVGRVVVRRMLASGAAVDPDASDEVADADELELDDPVIDADDAGDPPIAPPDEAVEEGDAPGEEAVVAGDDEPDAPVEPPEATPYDEGPWLDVPPDEDPSGEAPDEEADEGDEADDEEFDEDEATESVPRPALPPPAAETNEGAGNLSSLNAWLGSATTVDDSELDFFSDHDYERGGDDEGAFSTKSHNLDKVEVTDIPEEVIQADEAPTAHFSAPVLSEDEALGKLLVANDVLSMVVRAFDEAEGAGRGRALVQLLVDGSPSRYAALLQDVQVEDDGRLPDLEILQNLYGRPSSEHRHLINQTLVDIVERALSSAADELPDEAFDGVLERVAGYRQRLGL